MKLNAALGAFAMTVLLILGQVSPGEAQTHGFLQVAFGIEGTALRSQTANWMFDGEVGSVVRAAGGARSDRYSIQAGFEVARRPSAVRLIHSLDSPFTLLDFSTTWVAFDVAVTRGFRFRQLAPRLGVGYRFGEVVRASSSVTDDFQLDFTESFGGSTAGQPFLLMGAEYLTSGPWGFGLEYRHHQRADRALRGTVRADMANSSFVFTVSRRLGSR